MRYRLQRKTFVVVVMVLCAIAGTSTARAQSEADAIFNGSGFQGNRDYFSGLPFEHIDTATGGLTLTFTDLILPGNAGQELRFQRTYNSKSGYWTFGIAGIVFRVSDPFWPNNLTNDRGPTLFTADGGEHRAATPLYPNQGNYVESRRIMMTDRFWKYYRSSRLLWMPDGSVSEYDSSGRLFRRTDAFGNVIDITWIGQDVQIFQHLGGGQSHLVTLTLPDIPNCNLGAAGCVPASMTFNDGADIREWSYNDIPLAEVISPEGTLWQYAYGNPLIVTTPHGGQLEYTFETYEFPTGRVPDEMVFTTAVRYRDTVDVRGESSGRWEYEYDFPGPDLSNETKIIAPDGITTTYQHRWWSEGASPNNAALTDYMGRTYVLTGRLVHDGTQELEREERAYEYLAIPSANTADAVPELKSRIITRDGREYRTTLTYGSANYREFHNPTTVFEEDEGDQVTRTATREYIHSNGAPHDAPYIVGLLTEESVSSDGETATMEWGYDPATGFKTSETRHGIETTFTDDGRGNVASITKANDKITTFTYSWGRTNQITTPAYAINRVINPDGTVAQETEAGRTTSYQYDDLSRVTQIAPPGGANHIVTTYDPAGATVTVTAYLVDADIVGPLTINGSTLPVALPTPSQKALLTFSGTAGQQVTVRLTNNTMGQTTVRLLRPNGTAVTLRTSSNANFNLNTATLSATATYTVEVDPNDTNVGGISVQVTSP